MLIYYLSLIETDEDQLTFMHIYEKYGKQMHRVTLGILRKPEAAEDALQDAFEGIATSIRRIPTTSESAIKAYVLTVARNAALAVQTEEQKREFCINIEDIDLPSKEDTFQAVSDSQNYKKLLELINQLPLQYREVMLLRYVMELKPKEIGMQLNRKTTTVQQQLTRGKRALSALYEQEVAKNA